MVYNVHYIIKIIRLRFVVLCCADYRNDANIIKRDTAAEEPRRIEKRRPVAADADFGEISEIFPMLSSTLPTPDARQLYIHYIYILIYI